MIDVGGCFDRRLGMAPLRRWHLRTGMNEVEEGAMPIAEERTAQRKHHVQRP